ncbi:NarG-like domain protein [Acididesulfobacillus acetoxydans]|uniref:NarG-like domain protein n=1 Tax=Acididesulfobacillus acetoxydans TaxID=1561005 RepID=A0A8S0XYH1_9FIRM|nr:nitrate reductase gamma subunit [Acididesulfobacillus acetoxydans]CAA7602177.1 NarG-like domain protein [Acididesulfobacillus acetoxydans]CEJ08733.1 Nitrate reductase gamma subunit [Acididesulfobacillus acetoxydans]
MFLTLYSLLAIILFLAFSAYKAAEYAKMPIHGRLDLYPIPKEGGRLEYGGSYYEELEWWRKPRHVSHGAEIIDMLKEMLFIKKLFDNQRPFWWLSYAFHLGIYCLMGWTVLLAVLAVAGLNGVAVMGAGAGIVLVLKILLGIAGVAGFLLAVFGSGTLLIKRMADSSLRRYTTPQEYFNLLLIFLVLCTGIYAWSLAPSFDRPLGVMEQALSLQPLVLSGVGVLHVILLGIMFFYIPLSKMSHYVGKYFTFHKVLWDNSPNTPGSAIGKDVEKAAGYRPHTSWSAPHIKGNGATPGKTN